MTKNYEIKAAAGASEAELLVYGDIGESWWGESVTAKATAEQLQALDVDTINVRINSYGGSVADGLAIFNSLRSHRAAINVRIDGVAVSIASLIAMAGDTVEMAENALFMVHAPWGGATGNAKALREYADTLDTYAKAMSSSYARKTGQDHDTIMALLTDGDDHWYTAAEAQAFGYIDTIIDEAMPAAAGFDQSRFNRPDAGPGKTQPVSYVPAESVKPAAMAAANINPKQETVMTKQAPEAASVDPIDVDKVKADTRAEIQAAETQRKQDIKAAFSLHTNREGVNALLIDCISDDSVSVSDAQAKLLDHLGKGAEPLAGQAVRIETGETEREKFAKGAQAALAARAGQARDDGANEMRGYSLIEMARRSLVVAGVRTEHLDKMGLVAAAFTHSTSDFTNVLVNLANKSMLKGWEEAEETFQLWTNKGTLPDFKQAKRVDLNAFPSLAQVRDGAEYTYATVGDRGETIQLATYGKLFSLTRQTIINDDLDAFTRIPMKMGRAAIRTVGDLVYAVLTSNPTMSDSVALFHASHSNLPTGAAISTTSVDAMRAAMAKQTDGGSNASALNIRLANLIVPVALEGTAKVVRDSEFEVGASTKNNTTPNTVRGTFEVISDARLDASSASVWYGAANPGMHDTVEVAYLDGNEAPVLEQQAGWSVDGTEFKVRMDAGVSPLDFRTLSKNAGA
jgi:ATP-dependent protease ClpP protease subunit